MIINFKKNNLKTTVDKHVIQPRTNKHYQKMFDVCFVVYIDSVDFKWQWAVCCYP